MSAVLRESTALLLVCVACSSLTDVNATNVVAPSALANQAGADAFRAGALARFAAAFAGGSGRSQVSMTGLMADEFFAVIRLGTFLQADSRTVPEGSFSYPYAEVQRARVDAQQAITALKRYAPQPGSRIGEIFALRGFTKIFLAENLCAGIPLGGYENGQVVYGEPLTILRMLDSAIADFDAAVPLAADSLRILNLSRIGRGRALINMGRFSDARAAVASVATPYSYTVEYAATSVANGLFQGVTARYFSVADMDGGTGLDFRSARDPRVPTAFIGKGSDGVTDVYAFTRYSSVASPVVLASGVEARLIEAEAALQDGDAPGALVILNALRAAMPGLAPLPLENTEERRIDQLFRERAFWLFGTGHRHGDLRRLARQYRRPVVSIFPTGAYPGGQTYGSDVTFTPDETQTDNPKYRGCANRDP
jgi:hypothetical protein